MKPLPFQEAFAELTPSPGVVLRGGRLSYITTALVYACARGLKDPRNKALLVSNCRSNRSVQSACIEIFAGTSAQFHSAEQLWRFDSGASIALVAAVDGGLVDRLRAQTFSFVGFDNVTETDPSIVQDLAARARSVEGVSSAVLRATSSLPAMKPLPPWIVQIFPRAVSPDRRGGVS